MAFLFLQSRSPLLTHGIHGCDSAKQIKVKSVESVAGKVGEGSMVRIQEHVPSLKKSSLNFHQEKMLLLLYLLYFLLQVGTQYVFLFLPMYQHLLLVSQASIHCRTDSCPGPYLCLVGGPWRSTCPSTPSSPCLLRPSSSAWVFSCTVPIITC